MKLPGITYGPVQPLGRVNVGGEVAAGRAQAQALEAVAGMANDIYEQQSVAQAEKALLMYDTGLTAWQQEQTAYQADGTGTWMKGDELYAKAEQSNRKIAEGNLKTPMARMLFERKAEQRNVDNQLKWGAKQLGWVHEDNRATAFKTIEEYTSIREFNKVYETVAREKRIGTLNPVEAEKIVSKTAYLQKYYVHSDSVDSIANPTQGYATIADIKADMRLDDRDKATLISKSEDTMIQMTTEDVTSRMLYVKEQLGWEHAVAVGEAYKEKVISLTAEQVGHDENFKLSTVGRIEQVINNFKGQIVKATAEGQRLNRMNRWATGQDAPTKNTVNDLYATTVLGFGVDGEGTKYHRGETGTADIYKNPEVGMETVNFIQEFGMMPDLAYDSLDAGLQDRNSKYGINSVMVLHQISQVAPQTLVNRGNSELKAVSSQAQMLGGTQEAYGIAYQNYLKVRDMDKKERAAYYHAETFNKAFEEEFSTVLEKNYPVDTPFYAFWQDSTAGTKLHYQNMIKTNAKDFLPYTGGDTVAAMNMAMYSMRSAFGVSRVNGNGSPQLMDKPPEQYVENGNYDGGLWIRAQTVADIKAKFGEDYNTEHLRVEPVPQFNPADPAYMIYDDNPELGFTVHRDLIRYDFTLTPEYAQQQAEAEARARYNEYEKNRQRNVVQHELNEDPNNKVFYPPQGGKGAFVSTPYGYIEKEGPFERGAVAMKQGFEAPGMLKAKLKEMAKKTLHDTIYDTQSRPVPERLPYPGGG